MNVRVFAYGMLIAIVFGLCLRRVPCVADVPPQSR